MWYWLFKYILLGPLLTLLGRPKVEGLEHVPSSGPVILASNHLAVMDSFFLCLVVRRRITFPLCDARGRVLGFGARALGADQQPKYLNSPEGDVYHKGRQLFAVDIARAAAAKSQTTIVARCALRQSLAPMRRRT